ncbi:hypothetical protein GE061_015568 [Apolygus lucorum]|uniref:HAT C-terminal dimerisation domain-containing protein n=1 Tax=Apolygus lucorum TaxID=248454 RepID=A0A8S9XLE9_APOLU|nr:hypothetical protein GE061_015568 [Apolygus lucorum]
MIERFFLLSKHVAKILASRIEARSSVPDMMMGSQLTILEDLITLLKPLKEATEDVKHFTPALSAVALKYLITQASSVPSERAASTVNMVVPDNRSRLTAEHIRQKSATGNCAR